MEEPSVEDVERPFGLINEEAGTPWGGGVEGLTVRVGVLGADIENIREASGGFIGGSQMEFRNIFDGSGMMYYRYIDKHACCIMSRNSIVGFGPVLTGCLFDTCRAGNAWCPQRQGCQRLAGESEEIVQAHPSVSRSNKAPTSLERTSRTLFSQWKRTEKSPVSSVFHVIFHVDDSDVHG